MVESEWNLTGELFCFPGPSLVVAYSEWAMYGEGLKTRSLIWSER